MKRRFISLLAAAGFGVAAFGFHERMGQGRENARQFLKDNADIREKIEARMRKTLGLPVLERVVEPKSEKAEVLPMPEKKKA